ncbi:5'-nucleotidase/2',3'-cyclic-nucleotide 2'-phosphodiesterase/3'-nucleotidase/5'-nucleotidase [Vreelandella songnenensis]|uniref:5'-nucleotidase/2',3'-cyclic-nucleotide 2'-phosphodiesterase/3'-nucleotidase/5'-nucleotidase n=1 Tax=Vreelandella songnenensis TaxID=1176243 RepID=A0A2T0V2P9_9GAMM|nr:5'-nucleotidase C-terminal domain-containing protein [Halomonas songnenensis]PRY64455.1 5'-nucleotidase/2',3'-cyclic-nucleotide 2'-phosphodiesterase/3'-nucleotidase/5'-nucleotidase [Halomonas songnenensis]
MRVTPHALALGVALGLFGSSATAAPYTLTLFHTNDLHGRTDSYPQLISALADARERFGDGLLLDAGDIFSGTLYFNEYRGQDAVEFMNLMGYDAFVPGNHEFDLNEPEQGHQALVALFEAADFPILGANLDFSAAPEFGELLGDSINGEPELKPQPGHLYDGIVVEQDGERIGIFGLSTQSSDTVSSPGNVTIGDYREAAEAMVAAFEAQGVNKIVALTHLGYDSDPAVGNDVLLAQHVEGIDVIIGGHSHTRLASPVIMAENDLGEAKAPTVIGQANEYGKYLGVMQVTFDDDGVVTDATGELLATEDFEPDAQAAAMLAPYTARIEEVRDTQVGVHLVQALPNPRHGKGDETSVRADETALGNLIADGQLAAARRVNPETVLALQNGGGIREPVAAGEVTVGELIAVQPFGNRLTLMDVTGAELLETFEIALANAPEESGAFLQISRGTEVEYDSRQPPGERVVSLKVTENGELQAIDPARTYTIATNNFTAAGGDSHAALEAAHDDDRSHIVGNTDWEMLRDYLVSSGEVAYQVEGRLKDIARP